MTTDRRQFLGTTGLLAAAVAAGARDRSDRIVIGLIGPGGIGMHHVRQLARRKDAVLAYVEVEEFPAVVGFHPGGSVAGGFGEVVENAGLVDDQVRELADPRRVVRGARGPDDCSSRGTAAPRADGSDEMAARPESAESEGPAEPAGEPSAEEGGGEQDEWPVHRRLIRATLPRPEGQTPERKAPDFTFRPGGSGGRFDPNRNGKRHRGHRPMRHGQGGQGQRQRATGLGALVVQYLDCERPAGQRRGRCPGGHLLHRVEQGSVHV